MSNTRESKDKLPSEFASAEETGRFWDAHDSNEYLAEMEPVETDTRLERRRFEIEIDADVLDALRRRATAQHVAASILANDLLRKELAAH